jgi:hypothetical protein
MGSAEAPCGMPAMRLSSSRLSHILLKKESLAYARRPIQKKESEIVIGYH